jgi:hypothetical protein
MQEIPSSTVDEIRYGEIDSIGATPTDRRSEGCQKVARRLPEGCQKSCFKLPSAVSICSSFLF